MVAPTNPSTPSPESASGCGCACSGGCCQRPPLAERLNDPATARAVHELLDVAPDLAGAAKLFVAFVRRSSDIAENVNGMVETARNAAGGTGASAVGLGAEVNRIRDQLRRGSELFENVEPILNADETQTALREIVAALPKLMAIAKIVEQFVGRSSDIAENVNGIVDTFRAALDQRWPTGAERAQIAEVPGRLMETVVSPSLHRLLQSRLLSAEAITVMDRVAACVVEGNERARVTDARVGLMGLMGALRDPGVQRGLGTALEIARAFGASREDDVRRAQDKAAQ